MPISESSTPRVARPELRSLALIHRTFWVPTAALNLAVLRIAVFSTLAVVAMQSHAVKFARLPDDLLAPPRQIGDALVWLPRTPSLVTVALWLLITASLAAAVGWRTRGTALIAALLSLYVLGIPQLYGKVDHYHHLVWLAVLLACSPCGDELALDARHRDPPAPSARYGFPLRVAWLLIGLCYFFPGLAKLAEARVWLSSSNLRGLLDLQQWAAHGGVGVPDWALFPLAVGTLVFELGFVFAVFNRRLRPCFLVAGLVFHFGTFATMSILFWNLWVLYVAFIDWSRFSGPALPSDTRPPTRAVKAVSAMLLFGAICTGLTSLVSAWPFASYPTFSGSFAGSDRSSTTQVIAISDGHARVAPVLDWLPSSRRAAVIANAMEHPRTLAELGRQAVPQADTIQVWRVVESTEPATRGDEVTRRLLLEIDVP